MRRNRGEFLRDLAAVDFLRAEDFERDFFFGVDGGEVVGGCGKEEAAGAAGV